MKNAKRIGNCFLHNMNGKDEFFPESDVIRGINTGKLIFLPVRITASILYLYTFFAFNLVPLQRPSLEFRNNITWELIFNSNSWSGSPSLIEFSASIGNCK